MYTIDGQFISPPSEEELEELRLAEVAAKKRLEAELESERKAAEAARQEAVEAEAKQIARLAWQAENGGSDEGFAQSWPSIRKQQLIEASLRGASEVDRVKEEKLRTQPMYVKF
jgi:hypothetical protein